MRYRIKTGMLAWLLFRITGLALVLYLVMHIHVISSLHDPDKFDKTMAFLGSWQFRILEIGLLAAILVHSMNGVRIFLIDFWNGSLYQAKLFWILLAIGFILLVAGGYPIFSHAIHARKTAKVENCSYGSGATTGLDHIQIMGEHHAETTG